MVGEGEGGIVINIGIDPGVNTGIAVSRGGELVLIRTVGVLDAMDMVLKARAEDPHVWWEDARKRAWFGSKGREALQGAGSIKRDCTLWVEFFERHEIRNTAVAPKSIRTKLDAGAFARTTGWSERTNEHGRDAAMLIWGRK